MSLTIFQLLELAAIVVAGTMVGNELAVAVFVHPRLSRLDDANHVRAVQPLAAALGAVMPFWYALALLGSLAVAFLARPADAPGHGRAVIAAGLFAAMIVYTVLLPVPINNQVARWRPEALPDNWRELRRRWDTAARLSGRGARGGFGLAGRRLSCVYPCLTARSSRTRVPKTDVFGFSSYPLEGYITNIPASKKHLESGSQPDGCH